MSKVIEEIERQLKHRQPDSRKAAPTPIMLTVEQAEQLRQDFYLMALELDRLRPKHIPTSED